MEKNIFVVGPEAHGESFFGRKKWVAELSNSLFAGTASISLVGATRIGKSSLVKRVFEQNQADNYLKLYLNISEYGTAFAFWSAFWEGIRGELEEHGVMDGYLLRQYARLDGLRQDGEWYTPMNSCIKRILAHIRELDCRMVLAVDEFDGVANVFGNQTHYYQLLRTICSDGHLNSILLSRRNLYMLEKNVEYLSTFHGVFDEQVLRGFQAADMEEFYAALARYGIILSKDRREMLEYYTGNIPYLCCMFAREMVAADAGEREVDEDEVKGIYRKNLNQINTYYDDLIDRLKADNHMETLLYISFGSMMSLKNARKRDTMLSMGYLVREEKQGEFSYYAYTKDFMTYLSLKPLELPAWELLTASEKKIKQIFGKEYPELECVSYAALCAPDAERKKQEIDRKYPELQLNWDEILRYARTLSVHKSDPSVLDVLTLTHVIGVMLNNRVWSGRFLPYFKEDAWRSKLALVKKLRNPMAHSQEEFIKEQELSAFNQYCDEIVRLPV